MKKVKLIIPFLTLKNEIIEVEFAAEISDVDAAKLPDIITELDRPRIEFLEESK